MYSKSQEYKFLQYITNEENEENHDMMLGWWY